MDAIIDNTDIAGDIRIDSATQRGSAIDVVRSVLGCNSSHANTALTRLKDDFPEFGDQVTKLRIDGKGRLTPVADAKTLVEIVFLLPGKIARDFRRKSAAKVCRLLGGDSTLVSEIEQRRTTLESTAEGRATRSFLLQGTSGHVDQVQSYQGMPTGFAFLSTGDREVVAKKVVDMSLEREQQDRKHEQQIHESDLKRRRCIDMIDRYKALGDIGVELDPRTKIEIRDNVSLLTRRDLAIEGPPASSENDPAQDPMTPTHALGPGQRGKETGIALVAAKMGVRVPAAASGVVGKLMKKMYINKYGLPAEWNDFVKRQTLFRGRPIMENCYYERDEDVIAQAIKAVVE